MSSRKNTYLRSLTPSVLSITGTLTGITPLTLLGTAIDTAGTFAGFEDKKSYNTTDACVATDQHLVKVNKFKQSLLNLTPYSTIQKLKKAPNVTEKRIRRSVGLNKTISTSIFGLAGGSIGLLLAGMSDNASFKSRLKGLALGSTAGLLTAKGLDIAGTLKGLDTDLTAQEHRNIEENVYSPLRALVDPYYNGWHTGRRLNSI